MNTSSRINILCVSSRQLSPIQEWIRLGTQHLLQSIFSEQITWVLYDKNPDLLSFDGIHVTHKRTLKSNSFHHQTLQPFSHVVIAGTDVWTGGAMELLYGVLSKSEIPLIAMGLALPENAKGFSQLEFSCFSKHTSKISVLDESTKNYFHRYDLDSAILPCPSMFALGLDFKKQSNQLVKYGIVLQDQKYCQYGFPEKQLRRLAHLVDSAPAGFEVEIVCPTVNDFMRFSSMFGEKVRYFYDAKEYLNYLKTLDAVLTTHPTIANLTSSIALPTMFISESEPQYQMSERPTLHQTSVENLESEFQNFQKQIPKNSANENWKEESINQWKNFILGEKISLQAA